LLFFTFFMFFMTLYFVREKTIMPYINLCKQTPAGQGNMWAQGRDALKNLEMFPILVFACLAWGAHSSYAKYMSAWRAEEGVDTNEHIVDKYHRKKEEMFGEDSGSILSHSKHWREKEAAKEEAEERRRDKEMEKYNKRWKVLKAKMVSGNYTEEDSLEWKALQMQVLQGAPATELGVVADPAQALHGPSSASERHEHAPMHGGGAAAAPPPQSEVGSPPGASPGMTPPPGASPGMTPSPGASPGMTPPPGAPPPP
jgi:hypothetical protein